jgi:hypothetical protein
MYSTLVMHINLWYNFINESSSLSYVSQTKKLQKQMIYLNLNSKHETKEPRQEHKSETQKYKMCKIKV